MTPPLDPTAPTGPFRSLVWPALKGPISLACGQHEVAFLGGELTLGQPLQDDFKQLGETGHTIKGTLLQAGLERWARVAQQMVDQTAEILPSNEREIILADLLQRLQQGLGLFLAAAPAKGTETAAVADVEKEQKTTAQNKAESGGARATLVAQSKRILVLDDDPFICNMASSILEHLGYQPASASSGEEALQAYREALAKNQPFALVIVDANMPAGMQGAEAARELQRLDSQVRLLACSGDLNDPLMTDYVQYGFQGVLTKPYTVSSMAEAVAKMLQAEG